jgi:hypothetical protein
MKNQTIAVESGTEALPSTEQIAAPGNLKEGILSFSRSSDLQPEELLPRIINDDEAICNPFWCDTVRALIRKQPASHTRYDWMDICVRLVDIIESAANKAPPRRASAETTARAVPNCQRAAHVVFDRPDGEAALPAPAIPFEIGLQLLQGNDPSMGERTRGAVRALQEQAIAAGAAVIGRDEEIRILQQRLSHWKKLAQSRLEEMRRDMDFRRRMAFGQWNGRHAIGAL